jgi:hypothetical protein
MNIIRRMRRREIIRYACHIGVGDTDDLDQFLKAWIWHGPPIFFKKPIDAVQDAAKAMGRPGYTETEAQEIIEASNRGRALHKADDVGEYLRLSDEMRTELGIRTIGAHDVSSRQRTIRRNRRKREAKERNRREQGMRPQSQSRSQTEPWKKYGVVRRTYERWLKAGWTPGEPPPRRKKPRRPDAGISEEARNHDHRPTRCPHEAA